MLYKKLLENKLFWILVVMTCPISWYSQYSILQYYLQNHHLQQYAAEVPKASQPGKYTSQLLETTKGLPTIKRIHLHYINLLQTWHYVPDKEGEDHFEIAEEVLSEKQPSGDCDGFAATMMAVCRALGVKSQICLGSNSEQGHAWLEAEIYQGEQLPDLVRKEITREFGESITISFRNGYWYLQFSLPNTLNNYSIDYTIDEVGNLNKVVTP